ncbi:MAG TPA: hypothetical protein VFV66_04930 [Nonomuraea sp.]|nr:hypothetical protein [Nonomuraea sp.]
MDAADPGLDDLSYGRDTATVTAVASGQTGAAGVPIPELLRQGWSGATPVALRTLQRAFTRALSPAERDPSRHRSTPRLSFVARRRTGNLPSPPHRYIHQGQHRERQPTYGGKP